MQSLKKITNITVMADFTCSSEFIIMSIDLLYNGAWIYLLVICGPSIFEWASQVAQWWGIGLPVQEAQRHGFKPRAEKVPWRGKWRPTPLFLPRQFHGQRGLLGCSPGAHKELDVTEKHGAAWSPVICFVYWESMYLFLQKGALLLQIFENSDMVARARGELRSELSSTLKGTRFVSSAKWPDFCETRFLCGLNMDGTYSIALSWGVNEGMYVRHPLNTVRNIVTNGTCGLGTGEVSWHSLNQQNQESSIQDKWAERSQSCLFIKKHGVS